MIENRGDTGLLPGFIFGPFCCLRFAGFHVLDAFRHWERYRQVRRGDRLARVRRRVFLALLRPLRKGVSEKASLADLGRGPFFFSLSLRFLRGQLARVCRVGLTLSLIVPPQSILTLLRHLLRYEWAPRPIRRGERTHGGNGRLPPLPEVSDKLNLIFDPLLSLSLSLGCHHHRPSLKVESTGRSPIRCTRTHTPLNGRKAGSRRKTRPPAQYAPSANGRSSIPARLGRESQPWVFWRGRTERLVRRISIRSPKFFFPSRSPRVRG